MGALLFSIEGAKDRAGRLQYNPIPRIIKVYEFSSILRKKIYQKLYTFWF